jgi:hypothetical protein
MNDRHLAAKELGPPWLNRASTRPPPASTSLTTHCDTGVEMLQVRDKSIYQTRRLTVTNKCYPFIGGEEEVQTW